MLALAYALTKTPTRTPSHPPTQWKPMFPKQMSDKDIERDYVESYETLYERACLGGFNKKNNPVVAWDAYKAANIQLDAGFRAQWGLKVQLATGMLLPDHSSSLCEQAKPEDSFQDWKYLVSAPFDSRMEYASMLALRHRCKSVLEIGGYATPLEAPEYPSSTAADSVSYTVGLPDECTR